MTLSRFESRSADDIKAETIANVSLATAFENAADAVAILDPGGRLLYFNETFRELYCLAPGQWEQGIHRSICLDSSAFSGLRDLFSLVLNESRAMGFSTHRRELVFPFAPKKQYIASLSATPGQFDDKCRGGNSLFLLIIREATALLNERVSAVRRRFILTGVETRVLTIFASGADLNQIAHELGATVHTAKAHMKALLSKTGCRCQANLARLLETTPTGNIRIFI